MNQFAPIALFAFNRPDHLNLTLLALLNNPEAKDSDLTIFCDGPKKQFDSDVAAVRNIANAVTGFKSVKVIERSENWGLARSIITGVTELVNIHGRIIVLEDDIVTSPQFLSYMNRGLEKYKADERVACIHSWVHPVTDLPESFFLRGADCWGWATWKRGWEIFEASGEKLLGEIKKQHLTKEFDLDGTYPYTQMLMDQIAGKNNSWAIRWHASTFLQNRLTLYPGKTLVKNIGLDGSGTHCSVDTNYSNGQIATTGPQLSIETPFEGKVCRAKIIEYLRSSRARSRLTRAKSRLKRIIKKMLPSIVIRTLRKLCATQDLEFEGPYLSWDSALVKARGYASDDILHRVTASTKKVLAGEAAYERDSVTFTEPAPNWRLVLLIKDLTKKLNRPIHILDFGGALGSSYWQNRGHISLQTISSWNIIEQPKYVLAGRRSFETEKLRFFLSTSELPLDNKPDLVIVSAVLHYLEFPYETLKDLSAMNPMAIYVDRTPLVESDAGSLWIQKVPPSIYRGSYPCWVLSQSRLSEALPHQFTLRAEWDSLDGSHQFGDKTIPFKGLLFTQKDIGLKYAQHSI